MSTFFTLNTALLTHLNERTLILTPNRRMARHIQLCYTEKQTAPVWLTPRVYAMEDWLLTCWQSWVDSGNAPIQWLLSPSQELALWQKAVDADIGLSNLLSPTRALAKQASSSYRKLCHWQLSAQALTEDLPASNALKKWMTNFANQCRALGTSSNSDLPKNLLHAWENKALPQEKSIVLCGFESITPAHQKLLNAATKNVLEVDTDLARATTTLRTETESSEKEILAFAEWARDILQENASAKIALVVPDLSARRREIERQLMQVLEPHYLLPETQIYTAPINFSAGLSLAQQPIVFTALQLLNLQQHKWPLQTLLYLLHSPFWLDESQESLRAKIEKLWRKNKQDTLSAKHALTLLAKHEDMQPLSNTLRDIKAPSGTHTPARWAVIFASVLTATGWPGSRRLNSIEYQQVEQWQQCLHELACLDVALGAINLHTALSWIKDIAQDHSFQPKTAQSPIQVLGILEASGLHFTHLWLCGMSAKQWPQSPTPDPLLPIALQRKHVMPHASFEREFSYAKNLTLRFLHSTEVLVCSFAKTDNDSHQEISPLWSFLTKTESEDLLKKKNSVEKPTKTALQTIYTGTAPNVSNEEIKNIKGGFGLLRTQILCPFDAFAKHRLCVDTLDEPEHGISALERGNATHKILELFWGKIPSSAALKAQSLQQINEALSDCITLIINTQSSRQPDLKHAWGVEKKRLQRLLPLWLQQEQQRTDFTVIAQEHELNIELNGLPMTLRLDRIDQLRDGSLLLIDYKTGKTPLRRQAWFDEPPTEPQLPLYATQYTNVSGIAWAHINNKKSAYVGIGKLEEIPGLKKHKKDESAVMDSSEWSAQINVWQEQLSEVAAQFMQGVSTVCDKGNDSSHWQALKRLPEINMPASEDAP